MRISTIGIVLLGACFILASCSSKPPPAPKEFVVKIQQNPDGVVDTVWEEPMTDVVDVPPGLDPDGTYYRPAHKEVQEIRQGRWKVYGGGSPKVHQRSEELSSGEPAGNQ